MGGSQSVMTTQDIHNIVANTIFNNLSGCTNSYNATQMLTISGNDDIIKGVYLVGAITANSTCFDTIVQSGVTQSSITDAISSEIANKDVAGLAWASSSGTTVSDFIQTNYVSNFDFTSMETCTNKNSLLQAVTISGSDDYIDGLYYTLNIDTVSDCVLKGDQNTNMTANIASTINQYSSIENTNPLQPFADAISSFSPFKNSSSTMLFIVLIIVVLIGASFIIPMVNKSKDGGIPIEMAMV